MVWALVDLVAWYCAAEGNKVGTILSSRRGRHGAPDQITTAGTRVPRDTSGSCSSWYEVVRAPPGVMGHAVGRRNTGAVLGQRRPGPLALFSPGVFFDDAV